MEMRAINTLRTQMYSFSGCHAMYVVFLPLVISSLSVIMIVEQLFQSEVRRRGGASGVFHLEEQSVIRSIFWGAGGVVYHPNLGRMYMSL